MKFKDVYLASLCKNGLLGGMIYLKETEMVYCTNKLTVPEKIRRLHMPYRDIQGIEKAAFHTLVVSLKNGEMYRFLVFAQKSFLKRMEQKQITP